MSSTKNMHGGSAIECLPSEMLDAIFDCLLADDLYNQSRDGSEGHVDNDRHDNSQASGPFRYSPSIHALAQTSRTLHTKTLPWLYRTATIRSCIQQRRLLSRITQNPNIAPNVQHLILHEHEDMSSVLTRLDPIESTPGEAGRATAASTATAVRNMVITTTQGDVQENFGEEMRATTEACVDLVTLLLSCRHLKTFRYLGRRISSDGDSYLPYESYTKFQMIFALTWSRMIANSCGSKQQPPSTEQEEYRPFACLKQVYITELGPWSWSQFLRDLLSLPELDTLSYIFPIDAWAFSLDPSPTRSATLQDLHLSTTAVDQRNFRALFGAVQNLTSLHLDISGISFKERNFDTYINILREHGSLLAKLCITARSGALKKLPPVSFSLFTRVKILSVPDSLLYDNETTIDGFISRLPRKVEELTVTVQASRERTSALLVDPALNRDQLPALKKVTVLVPDHENGSANHELGVWLRPISRIFPSRSLGFHYGKVSTTQPLHSG